MENMIIEKRVKENFSIWVTLTQQDIVTLTMTITVNILIISLRPNMFDI